MDTTASWRLLPPAASSPPPRRQAALLRRHSAATTTSSSSGKRTTRLLCFLHDTPPPAPPPAADEISSPPLRKLAAALQCGAIWAAVEAPAALAVTGEEDLDILGILPTVAAIAFVYLFVFPPIIMNWMRLRWFKRKFVETYLQFMFTYLFFPGMMLWAPFVNFRKFPRDPTMKYPWSKPKEGTPLFKDRYPPIETYK
ncbi:NAD(P)H-quinone oxidoreductase subunit L, chloroplastic [Oryza glaberrima]|nr:NAD(P)H-quinone oxidoreductase subunit L, chloroplastic [Oryza glaberrima]